MRTDTDLIDRPLLRELAGVSCRLLNRSLGAPLLSVSTQHCWQQEGRGRGGRVTSLSVSPHSLVQSCSATRPGQRVGPCLPARAGRGRRARHGGTGTGTGRGAPPACVAGRLSLLLLASPPPPSSPVLLPPAGEEQLKQTTVSRTYERTPGRLGLIPADIMAAWHTTHTGTSTYPRHHSCPYCRRPGAYTGFF